jgi:hypothetical protein
MRLPVNSAPPSWQWTCRVLAETARLLGVAEGRQEQVLGRAEAGRDARLLRAGGYWLCRTRVSGCGTRMMPGR